MTRSHLPSAKLALPLTVATLLAACSLPGQSPGALPQLAAATLGTLAQCSTLAASFQHPGTRLTEVSVEPAGKLSVAGTSVGEHCLVKGLMNERISPVDGQAYAIGFEMRLPAQWNGRFLYQANGGLDGIVAPATGPVGGRGALSNGLQMGFAVISSDAGHNVKQLPLFGLDPQARRDYGYNAVVQLTPMAKALVQSAYGRGPDRSYFSGCSNGGRHAFVAASRLPEAYDGILAGSPGYNLPQAAVAQVYGAQQFAAVATDPKNLHTAFTLAERQSIVRQVLQRCDALDGLKDGLVQDMAACQQAFNLDRDVPGCGADQTSSQRTGQCLTTAQKGALGRVLAGARNSAGQALYSPFPVDAGFVAEDWAAWKFTYSVTNRDPVALGFVFMSPPAPKSMLDDTMGYALNFSMDRDAPGIHRSDAVYTESAMSFMTPPDATDLARLRQRGAKLMVWHGGSDGVFSPEASTAWYRGLQQREAGRAADFARLYLVPGMNHCGGGPATDQFNMLASLVDWVEKGQAPERVVAQARGAGNAGGANTELPADWSATRSRPLCPYPRVARFTAGNAESADSFRCE